MRDGVMVGEMDGAGAGAEFSPTGAEEGPPPTVVLISCGDTFNGSELTVGDI
jgi:hypothetical protein